MGLNGSPNLNNFNSFLTPSQPQKPKASRIVASILIGILLFFVNVISLFTIPTFCTSVSSGKGFAVIGILASISITVCSFIFFHHFVKFKKYSQWLIASASSVFVFLFIIAFGGASSVSNVPAPVAKTANNSVVASSKPTPASSTPPPPASSAKPEISAEDYKANCEKYGYKDVSRNPNDYKGKFATFTGQVIQVQESGKSVVLRVNVTKDEYGLWQDTIYVEYTKKDSNESRVLEKDIITLYGELNGLKTYTTVLHSELSIPLVVAKYIEISE